MGDYVAELRKLVGTRPLILPGTSVLVIDRRQRLLLVEREDTGDWGLPGGLMEPGESFEDTGRREVWEETDLELTEMTLFDVFSGPACFYRYPHGDQVHNVTVAYTARPATTALRPNRDEIRQVRFFDLSALPAHILPPEQPIIDRYLQERVEHARPRRGVARRNTRAGG